MSHKTGGCSRGLGTAGVTWSGQGQGASEDRGCALGVGPVCSTVCPYEVDPWKGPFSFLEMFSRGEKLRLANCQARKMLSSSHGRSRVMMLKTATD